MIRFLKYSGLILILFLLFIGNSFSQIDYKYLTGAQKGQLDTLSREMTKSAINQASGLLEKEIDPEKYIVGQNDEFSISIMTSEPREMDLKVSPDGTLLVPAIGIVDLKGKKLSESIRLIRDLVSKMYNSKEVFVVLKDIRRFKVSVSGSVAKTAIMPATAADRVSEIIDKSGGLKYDASMRNIILIRDNNHQRVRVDLLKFYLLGDDDSNPYLFGGDKIIVPPSNDKSVIGIYGEVASPGVYEFVEGDSLSTLIRFGLGFLEAAFLDSVEIVRSEGKAITSTFMNLNSWRDFESQNTTFLNDMPLRSGDRVYVRREKDWQKLEYVVVTGEVNYPGYYAIENNKDKVDELINRFGGFTNDASLESITYIRQSEFDKPDEEMERLSKISPSEMSESETRYYQSRKLEKRGVMSIDFKKILTEPSTEDNVVLVHRDSIIVPSLKSFVNVQGRVVNPGLMTFNQRYDYLDYINLAGGFGFRADESETIVNKSRGGLFRAKDKNYFLEPGDVILVPPEKELTFFEIFTSSLTIVTQLLTIAGVLLAFSNISKK